jgi:transposase-like protein
METCPRCSEVCETLTNAPIGANYSMYVCEECATKLWEVV